jgi:DNA-binding LacI/PurR family transcriptional regulator
MKYLYCVDHFVPFPQSEYGGLWNVIAESDEQCFDIIVCEDDDLNIGCYGKLRENIKKAPKYALVGKEESKLVTSFLT